VAYSDEVLADNPAGYWRLGEPSGTNANDESTNNLDGTYVNTPTLGVAGALTSDSDTAVVFTAASSESMTVPDNAVFDFGNVFTLEAWVKRTANKSVQQGIITKGFCVPAC
jgi:hypothetical protein